MCTCCTPAKRYHKFCIGFHGNKARVECRPVRDYLRRNQLVIYLQNSLTKGQENLRKLLISVTKREKKLEKALISKANVQGQNLRQYYSILNQMGVARNAWFGNYNGNQARIVMTQTEKFEQLDAANTCPRIHHLVTAIKKLGNLQHYTAAKFLTDEQIEDLKILIEDFVQHMVNNLDDTNVTPKAHYLLHIHENAERYKTLGLISEQAIEALHAFVNSIYSRASFFKKEDRDEWVMKYIFRQNILKDMSKKE
uniref:Uncharacterized protein n=1 Tax=Panagrolaimus superbus TaxID=310955 RepID=A0A914YVT3_9BILA